MKISTEDWEGRTTNKEGVESPLGRRKSEQPANKEREGGRKVVEVEEAKKSQDEA